MEEVEAIDPTDLGNFGDNDDGEAGETEAAVRQTLGLVRELEESPVAEEDERDIQAGQLDDDAELQENLKELFSYEAAHDKQFPKDRYPIQFAMDYYAPQTAMAEKTMLETMPGSVGKKMLVLHNLRYASLVASKYRSFNHVVGMDLQDLRQIAFLGLVKAAENYDPAKNVRDDGKPGLFVTYAHRVMKTMLYRVCNPNAHLKDTRTNARTIVLPRTEDGDDESLMDALARKSDVGVDRWEADGSEYLVGILRNLREQLGKSPNQKVSEGRKVRILTILAKMLEGKSWMQCASELGVSRESVREDALWLRDFLMRMYLTRKNEMKDLAFLFENSCWMKGAVKLRKEKGAAFYEFLYCGKGGYRQIKNAQTAISALAAANPLQRRVHRRQQTMNYDALIVDVYQRKYRLKNHFYPARGLFYTDETRERLGRDIAVPTAPRTYGLPRTSLFPDAAPAAFPPESGLLVLDSI